MPIFYGVVAGPYASLGTAPAQSGVVRIPNNSAVSALNAAGSADRQLIVFDTSNRVSLGASGDVIGVSNDIRPINGAGLDDLGTAGTSFRTAYVQGIDMSSDAALRTVIAGKANGLCIGSTSGEKLGFYGHAATTQQSGVAVTAAGVHAACVALGLFTA